MTGCYSTSAEYDKRGSSDQRAEHKEEQVRTHEGHGQDKAAETEGKGRLLERQGEGRLLERQGKHLPGNNTP